MLVSTHDGAINEVYLPLYLSSGISVLLDFREDSVPNACFTPAVKAGGYGFVRAIAFGQILPRSACSQYPQDAIDDCAMVLAGPARLWLLWWEQWL
jgi:hypothetical protein